MYSQTCEKYVSDSGRAVGLLRGRTLALERRLIDVAQADLIKHEITDLAEIQPDKIVRRATRAGSERTASVSPVFYTLIFHLDRGYAYSTVLRHSK